MQFTDVETLKSENPITPEGLEHSVHDRNRLT